MASYKIYGSQNELIFDKYVDTPFNMRLYREFYQIIRNNNKDFKAYNSSIHVSQSKALGTYLETEGFFLIEVVGDGNCGPRSICMWLYGHQRLRTYTRRKICHYMLEEKIRQLRGPGEPEIGPWLNKEQWIKRNNWVKKMNKSRMNYAGTWFTDREIQFAALCFDMTIICFSTMNGSTRFDCEFSARTAEGRAKEKLFLYHH